jgi:hypothetical protein
MHTAQNRDPNASVTDNRLDWWLREFGHPPTREALLRIRWYKRARRVFGRRIP